MDKLYFNHYIMKMSLSPEVADSRMSAQLQKDTIEKGIDYLA